MAYLPGVPRHEIAERAEQSPPSSGYSNNLGALRNSWELIEYDAPDSERALPLLFMDE